MHNMVTKVNNTVLYTWNLLTVDLECSLHQKKTQTNPKLVTMWGDGCVN